MNRQEYTGQMEWHAEGEKEKSSLSPPQLSPTSQSVLGGSRLCLTFCWSGMQQSPALLWWGWRWWPCAAVKPGTRFTHTQTHTYKNVCVCVLVQHMNQPHSFDSTTKINTTKILTTIHYVCQGSMEATLTLGFASCLILFISKSEMMSR